MLRDHKDGHTTHKRLVESDDRHRLTGNVDERRAWSPASQKPDGNHASL